MVEFTILAVGVGLLLAFAGRRIFQVALVAFGAILGGGAGWTAATASGENTLVLVAVGMVIGIATVQIIYVLSIVLPGFALGGGVGLAVTGSPEIGIVLGVVGAMLAWALHVVAIVLVTAFGGAMLVSLALFGDPNLLGPSTLVVGTLGTLVQFGIAGGGGEGEEG